MNRIGFILTNIAIILYLAVMGLIGIISEDSGEYGKFSRFIFGNNDFSKTFIIFISISAFMAVIIMILKLLKINHPILNSGLIFYTFGWLSFILVMDIIYPFFNKVDLLDYIKSVATHLMAQGLLFTTIKNIKKRYQMLNKKILFLSILITAIFGNVFADNDINFTLEINGVSVNDGQLHIKVYSNDRDYRNDNYYRYYIIESTSSIINYTFNIPEGEYLIIIFQDTNNNGILDTNFLGIPKEPSGISNYSGGIPTGWNRHKFLINNNSNRLMIRIGRA